MRLHNLFKLFVSYARSCAGNVTIYFAIVSPAILLMGAAALDYSYAVSTRAKMQAALDGAVIAGARASSTTVAGNYFTTNMAPIGSAIATNFNFNANGSLSGTATYSLPTLFGGITGDGTIGIDVAATASAASSPVCILLLAPSTSQSLLANSGTNINAPSCEIDVKSTANPVAIFNSGVNINMKKICLQGANYIRNGGTEANLSASCSTASNPYVGKLPAPVSTACSGPYANGGNFSGSTVTLSPGVYCGWFNFNGSPTVTLQPGVYVIKNGGWNVNGGKWTGTGVSFYFADTSKIQFNSGMTLNLSAPTSGTYSGILFYEPDGLSNSQFVFDDSVGESLSGLIYLPSRSLTFNSTSNETTPNVTVIAYSAIFDSLNWSLTPNSQWPISSGGGGSVSLTQ
jgi:hypothetical protein